MHVTSCYVHGSGHTTIIISEVRSIGQDVSNNLLYQSQKPASYAPNNFSYMYSHFSNTVKQSTKIRNVTSTTHS